MAQTHAAKKRIHLSNITEDVVVPEGKIWEIPGLKPYQSERGIGTADLYLDGEIFIGQNKSYTISGKFDICINNNQSSSIWLLAGTKVRIGDSRGRINIFEHSK